MAMASSICFRVALIAEYPELQSCQFDMRLIKLIEVTVHAISCECINALVCPLVAEPGHLR
jgi:hypothetical protein